ncbi:MAG: hypothetical protein ABIR48_07235 [Gammaproteobacteria bacterium]
MPLTILRGKQIHLVAILISFALSAWAVYSDGIVNRDGILYLETAAQLEQGNWPAARALYEWPFYSALIASISHLSGLGIEASAQGLNALLFALIVYAFIGVVGEMGGGRRTLIAAALVILLQPQLNEHRADIFRDNGYWAFYLLALWLFIKYFKMPRLCYAWAWGISIVIALLFRIEGMVFLCLLPLTLLLKHDMILSQRLRALAGAYVVGLAGLFLLAVWWAIDPVAALHNVGRLGEPLSWLSYVWQGLGGHLQEQAARLNQAILNQFSASHALQAVIATLLTLLFSSLISALSLVYALLILHSFVSGSFRARLPDDMRKIILWLVLINLVVLSVFLVKMFFLTGRYPMPAALTLMLILPFHLTWLAGKWHARDLSQFKQTAQLGLIAVVIFAVAVDGLVNFGPSKYYLKTAGLWIAKQLPADAKLYTNDEVVAYYAGRWQPVNYDRSGATVQGLRAGTWRNFDYVAIRVKKHDAVLAAELRKVISQRELKVFKNNYDEKLWIFKVQPTIGTGLQ